MTAPACKDCACFSRALKECESPDLPAYLRGISASSNRSEDGYCKPEGNHFSPIEGAAA